MTDLGSLICRSSSEDETKAETQPDKRKMEQSKRASFIEISDNEMDSSSGGGQIG